MNYKFVILTQKAKISFSDETWVFNLAGLNKAVAISAGPSLVVNVVSPQLWLWYTLYFGKRPFGLPGVKYVIHYHA